jgi:multiple antibiotic resistance protein
MLIFSVAFSLFLLMDPIGNVPLYISFLKAVPAKRHSWVVFREMLIALVVIVLFSFIGDALMKFLHVGNDTLQIAGGIILFLICLKMIFPPEIEGHHKFQRDTEPFIVPLAIPLVAGPSTLAAVMIYAGQGTDSWIMVGAIMMAWIASLIILISSMFLNRLLGERGIMALERLMGLVLALISVQMFLSGLREFLAECHMHVH